jgi:cold shock CspA family protein
MNRLSRRIRIRLSPGRRAAPCAVTPSRCAPLFLRCADEGTVPDLIDRFPIFSSSLAIPASDPLQWIQSADDVHVATRDGEYAGHIVLDDDDFTVFGPTGQMLGGSTSLIAARRTLRASAHPAVGAPASRPPHAPRRRRRRGHVDHSRGPRQRRNDVMATGTVKWFNSDKGYGFIAPDDGGADLFAHFSAIAGSGHRNLEENQKVEYDAEQGQKGPQAANIRPL